MQPSNLPAGQTAALLDTLQGFVDSIKNLKHTADNDHSVLESVHNFARAMQKRVAKLGGVATPAADADRPSVLPTMPGEDRISTPARPSVSNSLDGYRPDRDVVAPISVRPNGMELLWVCGDCGEHYPRAQQCPESCSCCGAPKQHFYAPIED